MSHVHQHAGTSASASSDSVDGGCRGCEVIPRRIACRLGMAEDVLRMTACVVLYCVAPSALQVIFTAHVFVTRDLI
jgi:hypothetical protein